MPQTIHMKNGGRMQVESATPAGDGRVRLVILGGNEVTVPQELIARVEGGGSEARPMMTAKGGEVPPPAQGGWQPAPLRPEAQEQLNQALLDQPSAAKLHEALQAGMPVWQAADAVGLAGTDFDLEVVVPHSLHAHGFPVPQLYNEDPMQPTPPSPADAMRMHDSMLGEQALK